MPIMFTGWNEKNRESPANRINRLRSEAANRRTQRSNERNTRRNAWDLARRERQINSRERAMSTKIREEAKKEREQLEEDKKQQKKDEEAVEKDRLDDGPPQSQTNNKRFDERKEAHKGENSTPENKAGDGKGGKGGDFTIFVGMGGSSVGFRSGAGGVFALKMGGFKRPIGMGSNN